MINEEISDVLVNLVENAGGFLLIQSGTLAERPQSQPAGNLFIDKTTRIIYRFDGRIWESLMISSDLIEPSVSQVVTPSDESTKPEDFSPFVRSTSPY